MKKHLLFLFLASGFAFAQNEASKLLTTKNLSDRTQGWYISGNNSIMFGQSAFSNWVAGGTNSYSLNGNLDYEFNLTKGKQIWDNRVIFSYGFQKNEDENKRKTNDVIDLTSSYGYEIKKHWYLAAALNFKTQFDKGYDYDTTPYEKLSNFMSPGYLTIGLGVDYKPDDNLQINIHPATARFTFVTDKDLQKKGNFGLEDDGDNMYFQFGAFLGARYKFTIMKNITYDNRLGIYSDYLDKPLNMLVSYEGVLNLKVNDWVSAQVNLNLLYDENQIKKTQLKETLGVGFTYKFNNAEKLKAKEEAEKAKKEALEKSLEESIQETEEAVEEITTTEENAE